LILTAGAKSIRVFTPEGQEEYAVEPIETVSTIGAGDNFNAGYIYAMLRGANNEAERIAMAQRWSSDVCRQIGNNISNALAKELRKE
jgi:fructokinase